MEKDRVRFICETCAYKTGGCPMPQYRKLGGCQFWQCPYCLTPWWYAGVDHNACFGIVEG